MKRDYKLFIQDVLSAIESISFFIKDMSFEEFNEDDKTSSAVVRKLEIIGEAVKHIPSSLKVEYPEIPWKEIAGLRDRLIHGYFGVDYKLVWETITINLKTLKLGLNRVIDEIENKESNFNN